MDTLSLQPLLFSLLLSVLSVFVLLRLFHTYRQPKRPTTNPGLEPYPLLGHLPYFIHHSHRFIEWTTELLLRSPTHTISFRVPLQHGGVHTANPLNVEHMLKTHFANYPKGDRITPVLEDFLGSGIFNADEEPWRRQRKAASFEFSTRALRDFAARTVTDEVAGRLLPLLRRSAEIGEVIDLQDVLERFAFDVICRVTFGVDPACLSGGGDHTVSEFMRAFDEAAALSADRFMRPLPLVWQAKKLLDVGCERRLRQSIATVHGFAMKMIRSRKERSGASSGGNDDLLSRLVAAGDATDEFLRDIVISFILAGRETTSSALTWFFWLLSSRPDVEKSVLEETKATRLRYPSSGETLGFEELREMPYLHAAITESLRLYPPVAIDSFSCKEDDVLPDGTFVRKGSFATYNAYAMGRSATVWGEDCGEYRPERWVDESGAFRQDSPFRFPVFHAGPRACLGKETAYMQMKCVAASVLERFTVEVAEKGKPREHVFALTLRMKGGLPVYLRERERGL